MALTLLWDADGVLFKTFKDNGHFRWSETIEQDLGLTGPVIKRLFTEGWDDVLCGRCTAEDKITTFFTENTLSLSARTFIDYWLEKDSLINEDVACHLSRYPSLIASNQAKVRADLFLQWFGGRITRVFASHEIGATKPENAFFAFIEKELQLPPCDLCLIDDTQANIEAAFARGWQGHHFTSASALSTFLDQL